MARWSMVIEPQRWLRFKHQPRQLQFGMRVNRFVFPV